MKIGIIVSEFNGEITSRMLLAAREKAQSLKITISAQIMCQAHTIYP